MSGFGRITDSAVVSRSGHAARAAPVTSLTPIALAAALHRASPDLTLAGVGLGGQEADLVDGPLGADTSVGGFRVKRLLGEGAMGEVYLAQDLTLGRRVALKVIKRGVMQGEGLSQFLDEARRTASFSHPHIVTIHAFGEHAGRPFLALEYVDDRRGARRSGAPGHRVEHLAAEVDSARGCIRPRAFY
jgi:hypothetical protein